MATYSGNPFNKSDDDQAGRGRPPRSENDIVEAVPAWLQVLLQKYKERQGPLAGIQSVYTPTSPQITSSEDEPGGITDVLEDIATDAPKPQTGRLASSVDWGVASEPEPHEPPSAMDDLLASFEESTLEETSSEPTSESEEEDWLSGLVSPATQTGRKPDEQPSPANQPSSYPADALDEPDWLSELVETQSQMEPSSAPQEDQSSSWGNQEIPDWLSQVEPSSEDEVSTPASSAKEEKSDWASVTDELQAPQTDEEKIIPAEEDAQPPTASETPEVPDWLLEFAADQSEITQSDTSPSGADQDESTPAIEIPDWLAELDAAQEKGEDQPETAEPDVPQAAAAPEETSGFDWLEDLAIEEPISSEATEPFEIETSKEAEFPWDTQTSQVTDDEAPTEASAQDEAWLQELASRYPADPEVQDDTSDQALFSVEDERAQEEDVTVSDASAEKTAETFDWLTDTEEAPAETEEPSEVEEAELPDWLAALRTGTDAPETEAPVWEEFEFAAETPDWLREVESPDLEDETSIDSIDTEPIEDETETPDWLATLQSQEADQEEKTSGPEGVESESDLPNWWVGTEEEASDDEADSATRLPELQRDDDLSEAETPEWLAALQRSTDALEEEAPVVEDEVTSQDVESAAEFPAWLTEAETPESAEADIEPSPATDEDEAEMSDWLSELQIGDSTPAEELSSAEETGFAIELPDWLVGIEEDEAVAEAQTEIAEDEDDLSGWRAEEETEAGVPEQEVSPSVEAGLVSRSLDQETEIEETDAETEAVDWLMATQEQEDVEASATGMTAAMETDLTSASDDTLAEVASEGEAAEATTEIPSVEVAEAEAAETPVVMAPESDEEIPDWLAELEEEAKTAAAPGLPAWLTETKTPESEAETTFESTAEVDAVTEDADKLSEVEEEGAGLPVFPTEAVEETAEEEMMSSIAADSEAEESDLMQEVEEEEGETGVVSLADILASPPALDEETTEVGFLEEGEEQGSDWLTSLRAEAAQAESTEEEPPESISTPDWMRDDEEATAPEAPVERDFSEATPDWLLEAQMEAEETTETESSDLISGIPDWMVQAEEKSEAEAPPEEVMTSEAETVESSSDMPDWMRDFDEQPEVEASTAEEPAASVADWLSELKSASETQETIEEEALETEETEFEAAVPDWMRDLTEETEAEETVESEAGEADLDWLSTLQASTMEAETEEAEFVPHVPDWMTRLEEETETDVSTEEEEKDWLSELRVSGTAEETTQVEESQFVAAVPDWMTDLQEETDVEDAPIEGTEPEADWLSELRSTGPEQATETEESLFVPDTSDQLEEKTEAETLIEEIGEEDDSEETVELGAGATQEETTAEKIDTSEAELEGTLDWLSSLGQEAGEADTSSFIPAEGDEDALDWITSLEAKTADEAASTEAPAPDEEMAPPEVSESQIDIESALPDEEMAEANLAQLLAGIEAPETDVEAKEAKPAEDLGKGRGKDKDAVADISEVVTLPGGMEEAPPTPALAEADRTAGVDGAHQFFNIATAVPKIPALPEKAESEQRWPGHILRASLSVVFLLIIAIPLFNHYDRGGFPFPWLEPSPIEQQAIRNRLQGVLGDKPPGSVALVSFDYTPATEGEMNPLAMEVIKKLRGQGLRIVAISLEPEGAAVAQDVLELAAPDDYGVNVLNLGYRAGGLAAIRQLAFDNPLNNAIDFETGRPFEVFSDWPEIRRLSDIALIVDISATPDPPRWWVEQLESGDRPPMLAIVGAAAEPFVLPYVNSEQYDALIAGINGAAALEAARVQETLGPASSMLDSQSLAHLVIMTLMLFGTIAGLFEKYGQETM